MNEQERIAQFLAGAPHAVVGASRDRSKTGNRVLQAYLQNQRPVYPVNPGAQEIEGVKAFPDLASLPTPVYGVSVVTQPGIAEVIVEQAAAIGVKNIWLQPGAESERAVARAHELGVNVIAGGRCILVILRYRVSRPPEIAASPSTKLTSEGSDQTGTELCLCRVEAGNK